LRLVVVGICCIGWVLLSLRCYFAVEFGSRRCVECARCRTCIACVPPCQGSPIHCATRRGGQGLTCPWFEQILFLHLHTAYVRPTWVSPVCRMPAVIEVFQFSVPCRLRCRQSSTQGFLGRFSTSPTACLLCAGDTNASLRSPCMAGFQALPRGGAESDFSALCSRILDNTVT
jgi:hypothetical protein